MPLTCPGCQTPLPPPRRAACPRCGLCLAGPAAAELWVLDGELARLGRRRRDLLAFLYAAAPPPAHPAGPRPWPAPAGAPAAFGGTDASRFAVRNALLTTGGALLGIAAFVFALLSWSALPYVERGAILLALTAVALAAGWVIARRGLAATAETLAFVGLLLVGLDLYSAYAHGFLSLNDVDPAWYTAASFLAAALVWAGYDRLTPLRLTRPTTLVLAQFPLPLAVAGADAPPEAVALALLAVSLADLGARRFSTVAATAAGLLAGGAGTAAAFALTVPSLPGAPAGAALLMAAAAVALAWALRVNAALAVVAGPAASMALAAALPLPLRWTAAGAALSAVAVAAAASLLPGRLRSGTRIGAMTVLGASALSIAPGAAVAVLFPGRYLDARWAGVGSPDLLDWVLPAAPAVLALLFAVLLVKARAAAPPLAPLAVLTAAVAADAPYPAALALAVASGAALAVWAALDGTARPAACGAAVAASLWAAAYALATENATLAVLGALTVLAAACAAAFPVLRDGAVAMAALALGGFAAAAALAAGRPAHHAAFAVLAASGLALLAAALVRGPAAEAAPWPVAAAGIAMTAGHAAPLSLALAVTGVLAAAAALRPDRRPAGWAASALLLAAWWVRLGASGVTVPEIYTAPVSAALLGLAVIRRSRGAARSSWADLGPALASTLVPSLLAAWADATGPRPLLLAAAALATVLAGARLRLQAPLVLGGAVLVLDAARWLAPYAADAAAGLPGWVPLAGAGLLVLLAGATYEQRMRDLRRLRTALGRLA
ncbi:SCO7613 C-terminal domain-containing membrane protein [Actinomadura sp. NEAU-AAG7]|uniref:SCO7613 C-terminal domain-containing membrane protein n=1 Tax=Actinomadura sp. NEAU-AAG7 TaxID=2839640 RepID=UPI001BE49861|nr:hypothetical protein [Actinomadura sp. NEAU-AAG7]MBT2213266.1 hypothetical protein [Actinomadura sp. NEAU-AAG7]